MARNTHNSVNLVYTIKNLWLNNKAKSKKKRTKIYKRINIFKWRMQIYTNWSCQIFLQRLIIKGKKFLFLNGGGIEPILLEKKETIIYEKINLNQKAKNII